MNAFLVELSEDPWGRFVLQYLVAGGFERVLLSCLVIARLVGLFIVSPWVMSITVPLRSRIGVVVLLSCIIAPVVSRDADRHSDVHLATGSDSSGGTIMPGVHELGLLFASEVGLGVVLGCGVMIVFLGLKLGGEWLDRHCGLGLERALSPENPGSVSSGGHISLLLGFASFLLMEPVAGQSLLLKSLMDSFASLPPGAEFWSEDPSETVMELVHHSVVLGVRIALPLAVTMVLIDLTLALAGRGTSPPLSGSISLVRACLGLIVLAFTMTAIPEVMMSTALSLIP